MALPDDTGIHRFSIEDFLQLAETIDGRVELVDGVIYDVVKQSEEHAQVVVSVRDDLMLLRPEHGVTSGVAVLLEPAGMPIPDIVVFRSDADSPDEYLQAADVLLAVEVGLEPAARVWSKLGDYAAALVPEVWRIDRPHGSSLRVTVYTDPVADPPLYRGAHAYGSRIDHLDPELYIATF